MQFSKSVEYALHCLLYMTDMPPGKSVSIKDLATYQGVSETYLSKAFTKLRKSGIVKSVPGVNGGYELARPPENTTFWDVIAAIEGTSPFFQCVEIRRKEKLLDADNLPDSYTKCPCLIKVVMLEAEDRMKQHLANTTLAWLQGQVAGKIPEGQRKATMEWFTNTRNR